MFVRPLVCRAAACAALAALTFAVRPASAQNAYYTTGAYTIDAAHSVAGSAYVGYDGSRYNDANGRPYNPTVNLVSGGSVRQSVFVYNSSIFNISAGIIGFYLAPYDSSIVNVFGGSITNLTAYNLGANNAVRISGGRIGLLQANSNSNIFISGGTFGSVSGVNMFDATGGGFTLIGNNLAATNARSDSNFGGMDYDLSGTLQSGTNLNGYVLNVATGSTFTLQSAAVPEPGLLVSFALAGIGGGAGLLVRKRRACK